MPKKKVKLTVVRDTPFTPDQCKRLAIALHAARPAVIPGTRVIRDEVRRHLWYDCVTEVSRTLFPDAGSAEDAAAFFDAAGVPE